MTTANLRSRSLPITFGDENQRAAYEARCEQARENQRTRFAVAPLMTVTTWDRRALREGHPVTAADFKHDPKLGAPHQQLDSLVARGIVLENHNVDDAPAA